MPEGSAVNEPAQSWPSGPFDEQRLAVSECDFVLEKWTIDSDDEPEPPTPPPKGKPTLNLVL